MTYQHQNLANGRWNTFSFFFQMANIGGEISRSLKWQDRDTNNYRLASERALELLDLTIADSKNHTHSRLKELFRTREFMADYFFFGNQYHSTEKSWRNYFDAFAYAATLE
jgi:hypothetical protein